MEQALLGAEVVLHLTEWPEFRQLDPEKLGELVKQKVIIDGRLKLHAPTWRNAGWKLVQDRPRRHPLTPTLPELSEAQRALAR